VKPFLSIGEALWDLLPDGAVLGRAPLNFAYRVEERGRPCYLVSALGDDELGKRARVEMASKGIRTDLVGTVAGEPTGTVEITLDQARNPSYLIVPGVAYDRIPVTARAREIAAGSACVCYGSLVQRDPRSRESVLALLDAASEAERFFDVNLRPACYTAEVITESLARATIVKLNDEEAKQIDGMLGIGAGDLPGLCAELVERFPVHTVVITMGKRGSYAARRGGEEAYHPGFAVSVADPCGAGDAFSAAFLLELLGGASMDQALTAGNALGAIVASQRGATEAVADSKYQDFIDKARRNTTSNEEAMDWHV